MGKIKMGIINYTIGDRDDRPWGTWEVIAAGETYIVKRITVKPAQRLSLQFHHHREENWVIAAGEATVEIGETTRQLVTGDHVYIAQTQPHRITNTGKLPLVFIELQRGTQLDESDIVRLSDDYGR
jgi:mannose-6-phosphate isomerase-like protein (cupin superfamily)